MPHCIREPYRQNPLVYRKAHYHLKGLHSLSPFFLFFNACVGQKQDWSKERRGRNALWSRCTSRCWSALHVFFPLPPFIHFSPHQGNYEYYITSRLCYTCPIHFAPYLISCLTLKVPSVSSRLRAHRLRFSALKSVSFTNHPTTRHTHFVWGWFILNRTLDIIRAVLMGVAGCVAGFHG